LDLLAQFVFRLSFGLALAMVLTSPRWVTSGYFRNNLYVLLGLNVLAVLVAATHPDQFTLWPAVAGAVASYVGSVLWLYQRPLLGRIALGAVAGLSLAGAWIAGPELRPPGIPTLLHVLDPPSGGLLLGTTVAAMLLGHWYLNTPTMRIEPLNRLVLLIALAAVVRAAVCAAGLALEIAAGGLPEFRVQLMLLLRWLSALCGTVLLAWMAWQTLKIPNTQSATGILYVAVIVAFLGELVGMLLSAEAAFPL
jgi:hypothetical protein